MTDVVVLAECAAEVAVGQKDSAGTPHSRKGSLFSMVGVYRTHYRRVSGTAVSLFPFTPSGAAFPGTQIAGRGKGIELVGPLPEFVRVHLHIGGDECFQVYPPGLRGHGKGEYLENTRKQLNTKFRIQNIKIKKWFFCWILASGFWILLL
jgi:hypothetical protein